MVSLHFTNVTVSNPGQIVRYKDKLPAKAVLCGGITFSADFHNATKALAIVAVSFNGGKDQAITGVLQQPSAAPQAKTMPLLIVQPLDANTTVQGYVKDLGNAAYPYNVKIYYTLNY